MSIQKKKMILKNAKWHAATAIRSRNIKTDYESKQAHLSEE